MQFHRTALPEVVVVEPALLRDPRGWFFEAYHAEKYCAGGIDARFIQDNHSRSAPGTLRGLHAQWQNPQAKLVRVLRGEIFDVAVDIRRGSPNFLRWVGVQLSAENRLLCYVPAGFAHGFCVIGGEAEVEYKCTAYWDPAHELRIRWNDPAIGIEWPVREPVLSEKDAAAEPVAALVDKLPGYEPPPPG